MQVLFNDLNFSKTAIPDARTIDTKNFCCKNKLVNVGGKKRKKKKEGGGGWTLLHRTEIISHLWIFSSRSVPYSHPNTASVYDETVNQNEKKASMQNSNRN